jgi:DNA-directed RNA polymerase specialized sigma24 family protein
LDCAPSSEVRSVRYNILRVDLERALVQLPSTEKLIFIMHDVESYDHPRVARTLGLTEEQTQLGLHQARLYLRQLLGK